MSLPTVTGRGFLLSDGVELQFAKSGTAYARLPLIFKNQRKDESSGQWTHDKEIKVEATVFGALAEALAEAVTGRTDLAVSGDLYTEDWEDKEGKTRTAIRMNVNSVWPVGKAAGGRTPVASGAKASGDEPWPF